MNTTNQNKINIHCIVRDVLQHIRQAIIVGIAIVAGICFQLFRPYKEATKLTV